MKKQIFAFGLSVAAVTMMSGLAQAQLHDGTRTVFLQSSDVNWGAPMNVAYDANLDLYYTGGGGFASNTATVNNSDGTIFQATNVVVDLRGWNYNSNTGALEVVTYNAVGGTGNPYGFFTVGRDGSGNLDGTTSVILNSLPGLPSNQSMPAYDPNGDVLYASAVGSNTVNVVNRSDGSLSGTVSCANPGSNGTYSVGFDPDMNWLLLFDSTNSGVQVFDATSGSYVGFAATDLSTSSYGFGYANHQVWVYDAVNRGWQGYDIGASGGGSYHLSLSGQCPGTVTVSWSNATPNAQQAIVFGQNQGNTTIPNGKPCAGTSLGIAGGVMQIGGYVGTGANGSGSVNGNAGAFACGHYLQLVEGGSCNTSNVAQIP